MDIRIRKVLCVKVNLSLFLNSPFLLDIHGILLSLKEYVTFGIYFKIILKQISICGVVYDSILPFLLVLASALPVYQGSSQPKTKGMPFQTSPSASRAPTNLRISASVNPSTRSFRTLRGRPLRFGFLSSSESSVSLSEAEDLWACLLDSVSESLSFVWA